MWSRWGVAVAGGIVMLAMVLAVPSISPVPAAVARRQVFVREVTADGVVEAAVTTPIVAPMAPGQGLKVAWVAPEGSFVKAGDVVVRFDPGEFVRALEDSQDDHRIAQARRRKAEGQRAATRNALRSEVELARADVDYARRFQSRDETLFSRFSIAESAIDADLAEARLESALAQADTREQQLASGLTLADIEGRKAELRITQARAGLAAVTVTAPHDGILVLERDWRGEVTQAGQTAWPGEKLAEIPDLARLQVQVWVLEADAGGLAVGQAARVRLDAHPEQEVAARVARLEAVAKPRQRGSPVQYFAAVLELEGESPSTWRPGQRVTATITLDRLEGALVIPRLAVFGEEAEHFVWVKRGRRWQRRPVVLGPRSAALAVVTGGLSEGEKVALVDPETSQRQAAAAPAQASGAPLPEKGGRP
jgi:RND family efflux transporter MFP subunit